MYWLSRFSALWILISGAAFAQAASLPPFELQSKDLFPRQMIDTRKLSLPPQGVRHSPLDLRGARNRVLSGLRISNPNGPCIRLRDSQNIKILNSQIGPCKGSAIELHQSSKVEISGNLIGPALSGPSVFGRQVTDLQIHRNQVQGGSSSIYIEIGSSVQVHHNRFFNVQGPFPRGQFVQFNEVRGPKNQISCNVGENQLGKSYAEDAINLFKSAGSPDSYIEIYGNKIKGGGPSSSGGGIMTGDGGDSFFINVRRNILVDPGQYGIAAAGGHTINIFENLVKARSQPFTNVGLYVWDQYNSSCNNISVFSNFVNWVNKEGHSNPLWNHGNCGDVGGWDSNDSSLELQDSILDLKIPGC